MRYVIGIDEVGRGSLAGPVVVAACLLPRGKRIGKRGLGTLKDSKKLSAKQREQWNAYLRAHPKIHFAVARVNPRGIERMNVSRAANLASMRACMRLLDHRKIASGKIRIFLDGGLYLGPHRGLTQIETRIGADKKNIRVYLRRNLRVSATTVIRGDEKYHAVKAASIIAKVHRDRFMVKLAKKYPEYGFEMHKGYGTKAHFAAIRRHGPSAVHRLTFLKKFYRV